MERDEFPDPFPFEGYTAQEVTEAYGVDLDADELEPLFQPPEARGEIGDVSMDDWLDLVGDTGGRVSLRVWVEAGSDDRVDEIVLSRDDVGWVAMRRTADESFTQKLHYRPRPASLESRVADAVGVQAVLKDDLPMPCYASVQTAEELDMEFHSVKPNECGGCGLELFPPDAGGPKDSETDFRLVRGESDLSAKEFTWECVTCWTKTHM